VNPLSLFNQGRTNMTAKKTKTTVARDVDDYLSRLPEDSRVALVKKLVKTRINQNAARSKKK